MSLSLEQWRQRFEAHVHSLWDGDPSHDLGHFRRVWQMADHLARREAPTANRRVLLAASYLHDLVNLPKDSPERSTASRRSAAAARRFLLAQGFPSSEIDAVCHAIEAHSYSAAIPPRSIEAKIVQDADRLDSLGAIGLARTFAISGRMGRCLLDPDDPFARRRPLDDVRFAIDHVPAKLEKLPARMCTATGRRLAERRLAFVRRFLAELAREIAEGTGDEPPLPDPGGGSLGGT